jgi:hypothetical protein
VTTSPNTPGTHIDAAVTSHCDCTYDGDPFSLDITLTGALPAEKVQFRITTPTGSTDVRFPHVASLAGTVETSYLSNEGDPDGYYVLEADGNQGTRASLILLRSPSGLKVVTP